MDRFIISHRDKIVGTLSCFDRVIFKGHLPISYSAGMESFFDRLGAKLMEFKEIALHLAERLKKHAQDVARATGRPYEYLNRRVRKEVLARQIAARSGVKRGLICVFGTLEPVRAFRLVYGKGRPCLRADWRKCLVHYFYLIDSEMGFMHVRRPTWFPFTLQVYVNAHEWLARQMTRLRLGFKRLDNAFPRLDRPQRAQRLANQFARLNWPTVLDRFARRFNPLFRDVLDSMQYYWVADQTEYATDVINTLSD